MIERLAAKTTPLCFMPDGRLVCYQYGDIVLYCDNIELLRFPLFQSFKERILGRNKLFSRFMRLGIRSAIAIDNITIVLTVGNELYDLNICTGKLSDGFNCGEGVRPLILSSISNVNGFQDGVYFGGYLRNFEKNPVCIYHRKGVDKWEIVYTFPFGSINHVHNIIPDSYRKCLWILTGDFGKSAAIWRAKNGFKSVECVVGGEQKWRGCVAFAEPEGLIYATDAPFTKNHIYLLKEDGTAETICELPGSCIYGCQWNGNYVFSTTVEADGRNETMLRLLLGWKKGAGIIDRKVHLYVGNLKTGFKEAYKEQKDWWPFIFQFGAIRFPVGVNNSDTLFFQPIATKVNDMKLIGFEKDKT